jgi:hypothetical protein
MPPKKKPPVITVFGILNIIFGGLGLLGAICGGLATFAFAQVNMPGPGNMPNPVKDMFEYMDKHAPLYTTYMIFEIVIGLIMAVILIVAGIGLLKVRPWARWLSIAYAGVRLVLILVGLALTILVFNPVLADWQAEYNKRTVAAGTQPPPSFGSGATNNVTAVLFSILGAAFSIALLVVMFLPNVRATFARAALPEDERNLYDAEDDERPDMLDRRPDFDDRIRPPDERDL